MPYLSAIYGLKPWDIDRMTLREIRVYLRDIDKVRRVIAGVGQQQQPWEVADV